MADGAAARLAVEAQLAAVQGDDALRHAQAKPGAFWRGRRICCHFIARDECFEDALLQFARDAHARILHPDVQIGRLGGGAQGDVPARRELGRVAEQV